MGFSFQPDSGWSFPPVHLAPLHNRRLINNHSRVHVHHTDSEPHKKDRSSIVALKAVTAARRQQINRSATTLTKPLMQRGALRPFHTRPFHSSFLFFFVFFLW